MPLPFWRRASGQPDKRPRVWTIVRLVAVLVLEVALIVVLFIVVGMVIIPLSAPPVNLPSPTAVPQSG